MRCKNVSFRFFVEWINTDCKLIFRDSNITSVQCINTNNNFGNFTNLFVVISSSNTVQYVYWARLDTVVYYAQHRLPFDSSRQPSNLKEVAYDFYVYLSIFFRLRNNSFLLAECLFFPWQFRSNFFRIIFLVLELIIHFPIFTFPKRNFPEVVHC